jgi:hypothetical protein
LDEGRAIRAVTHKSAAGRKGLQSSSSAEGDQGASGSGEKMAFVGEFNTWLGGAVRGMVDGREVSEHAITW